MNPRDVILVKAKIKAKGIKRDTLAQKTHIPLPTLNKILDSNYSNPILEERLIRWLNKK